MIGSISNDFRASVVWTVNGNIFLNLLFNAAENMDGDSTKNTISNASTSILQDPAIIHRNNNEKIHSSTQFKFSANRTKDNKNKG